MAIYLALQIYASIVIHAVVHKVSDTVLIHIKYSEHYNFLLSYLFC